jgi:uncharacterized membrane protein (DUF2068 family)
MDKHPKGFFVRHFGLRGVALFEAGKGALAILAAMWVLTLRHKDMTEVAENLLAAMRKVFHINPDRHIFQIVQRSVEGLTPRGLMIIAAAILLYAGIRFVEGAGLWLEKEWAEWFALITGAFYIPFEVYQLIHRPNAFKWWILVVNLLIVAYLAWLLRDSYRRKRSLREAEAKEKSPTSP